MMYSNNILNFQEPTTILNTCTKKVSKFIEGTTYILLISIVFSDKFELIIIFIYITYKKYISRDLPSDAV